MRRSTGIALRFETKHPDHVQETMHETRLNCPVVWTEHPCCNKGRKVPSLLDTCVETYEGKPVARRIRDLHVMWHDLSGKKLDGSHGLLVGEVAPLEGAHKVVGAGFRILVQV